MPPSRSEPLPAGMSRQVYRAADPLMALVALVAEVLIVVAASSDRLTLPPALAAHAVVLAGVSAWIVVAVRFDGDAGPGMLLLPAVAFAGPFGALGGLLLGPFARRRNEDVERLEAWYRRISLSTELDPTARLADQVATNRTIAFDRLPAASMADLIDTGTVSEKQTILGIVARRFHPAHLPTLQRALISDEPVIRVQAAAVAAKIRAELPAVVDRLLKDASDASAPTDLIVQRVTEARQCVASGLLEAKALARAERLMDGILARTMLRVDRQRIDSPTPAAASSTLASIASLLLANRRFADYRRLRRAEAWAARGPWTYRPLPLRSRRSPANG